MELRIPKNDLELNNLLYNKLVQKDTWLNILRDKLDLYDSLKVVSKIEKDLIVALDKYDRACEEVIYSRISIIRVARNMQFKILERKEMIEVNKCVDINDIYLNIYKLSVYNVIRFSKVRYQKILRNALSLMNNFGLECCKEKDEIVIKEIDDNSIEF